MIGLESVDFSLFFLAKSLLFFFLNLVLLGNKDHKSNRGSNVIITSRTLQTLNTHKTPKLAEMHCRQRGLIETSLFVSTVAQPEKMQSCCPPINL